MALRLPQDFLPGYPDIRGPGLPTISASAKVPLWDASFSVAPTQQFPATSQALQDKIGHSAAPSAIYTFEDSGTGLADSLGNHSLTRQSGAGAFQQRMVGLSPAKTGMEITGTTDRWEPASTTAFDANAGAIAFIVVFRMPKWASTGVQSFFNKLHPSGNFQGWDLRFQSAVIILRLFDSSSEQVQLTYFPDDSLSCIVGAIRPSTGFKMDANFGTVTGASTFTPISTSTPFELGQSPSVHNALIGLQYGYLALFEGAAAETIYDNSADVLANFWTHGLDPSGKLDTTVYNPATALPSTIFNSDNHVAGWSARGEQQFPIAYEPALSLGDGYGLCVPTALTNLCQYSDELEDASWTKTNAAVSAALADMSDSPCGFLEGRRITASANAGYVDYAFSGAASTEYTISAIIWRVSGNPSGTIKLEDDVGNVASTAFSLSDDDYVEVFATGTTDGSSTAWSGRIELDTSGDAIYASAVTIYAGPHRSLFVRTSGASVTSVSLEDKLRAIETWDGADPVMGRGALTWRGLIRHPFEAVQGALCQFGENAPSNLRATWLSAGPNAQRGLLYDDTNALIDTLSATAPSGDVEVLLGLDWSILSGTPIRAGVTSEVFRDSVALMTGANTGTIGTATIFIYIAGGFVALIPPVAIVQRVRLWDEPQGGGGA